MEFGLSAREEKQARKVPLKAVDISGNVMGEFMHVKIVQKYVNEGGRNAEFLYTFPLPDKASVCGFSAKISEKLVKGEVREKKQAYREYNNAVRKGDSAFLLENFRPDVFQVSLGQVEEGEEIEIEIAYMQEIKVLDGEMRISIPSLVAPRYIPGNPKGRKLGMGTMPPSDRVPDADFITPPIGEADYRARINLSINAERKITTAHSPSHSIKVNYREDGSAVVSLTEDDMIMDRDFILVVKTFGDQMPLCTYGKNSKGEYFAFAAFTPELPVFQKKEYFNYIFLIDVSGSMSGEKLTQAKNAIKICLRNLIDGDTFNIAAFESRLHVFKRESLIFNQKNLDEATDWISGLEDMGGTEIMPAIEFALLEGKADGHEKIVMLFTDGQVGNEKEIVKLIKAHNKNVRLYSMGIDTSVNSYFINAVAEAGNGSSEFVYPGENVDDKVIRQFSRVNAAWMEGMKIEIDGVNTIDIPGGIPVKLYDLEPLSLIMKLDSLPSGSAAIKGCSGGEEIKIEFDSVKEGPDAEILEKLWARRKVEEMEGYLNSGNPRRYQNVKEDIIKLCETYGISSEYTSFVAIYERENKISGLPETVVVPVSVPYIWDMYKADERDMPSFLQNKSSISGFGGVVSRSVNNMCRDSEPSLLYCMEEKQAPCPMAAAPVRHNLNSEMKKETRQRGKGDEIKALAAKQNSDGSFGSFGTAASVKVCETAKALIAFSISSSDILPFRNQLSKAVDFLIAAKGELIKDTLQIKLVCFAFKLCSMRKIIRGDGSEAFSTLLTKLQLLLQEDRDIDELNNLIKRNNIEGLKDLIKNMNF